MDLWSQVRFSFLILFWALSIGFLRVARKSPGMPSISQSARPTCGFDDHSEGTACRIRPLKRHRFNSSMRRIDTGDKNDKRLL
jgi:hypothetical protein